MFQSRQKHGEKRRLQMHILRVFMLPLEKGNAAAADSVLFINENKMACDTFLNYRTTCLPNPTTNKL